MHEAGRVTSVAHAESREKSVLEAAGVLPRYVGLPERGGVRDKALPVYLDVQSRTFRSSCFNAPRSRETVWCGAACIIYKGDITQKPRAHIVEGRSRARAQPQKVKNENMAALDRDGPLRYALLR